MTGPALAMPVLAHLIAAAIFGYAWSQHGTAGEMFGIGLNIGIALERIVCAGAWHRWAATSMEPQ